MSRTLLTVEVSWSSWEDHGKVRALSILTSFDFFLICFLLGRGKSLNTLSSSINCFDDLVHLLPSSSFFIYIFIFAAKGRLWFKLEMAASLHKEVAAIPAWAMIIPGAVENTKGGWARSLVLMPMVQGERRWEEWGVSFKGEIHVKCPAWEVLL